MALQTNIERCSANEKCERCPKPAEFLLKTDNAKTPFPDGARAFVLCRDDLAKYLGSNPGLMAQVLVSLIEQRL